MQALVVNARLRKARYSNAGQVHPFLLRDGEASEAVQGGLPLRIDPAAEYREVELDLNAGDALASMVKDGATVFFSSHVMELAERLCTRIAVIHKGRIRACGTLEDLRELAGLPDEATLEDVFVKLVGEEYEPEGVA